MMRLPIQASAGIALVLLLTGCGKEATAPPSTDPPAQAGTRETLTKPEAPPALKKPLMPPEVQRLVDNLSGGEPKVRIDSAEELGKLGAKAAPAGDALRQMTSDEDRLVRIAAISALGELKTVSAVPRLVVLLKEDKEKTVRTSAARCLGRIGDQQAVQPLIEALQDRDEYTRGTAAWALAALEATNAVEAILPLTKDPKGAAREKAYEALGELGDPRAVEPLIEAMREEKDMYIRDSVAEALGKLGDRRALDVLLEVVEYEENGHVILRAAEALETMPDPKAVEPLIAMIKRLDRAGANRHAAKTLGKIGDPALGPLIEVLQDGSYDKLGSAEQDTIRNALRMAAGVAGRDKDAWLDWWKKNKVRIKKRATE